MARFLLSGNVQGRSLASLRGPAVQRQRAITSRGLQCPCMAVAGRRQPRAAGSQEHSPRQAAARAEATSTAPGSAGSIDLDDEVLSSSGSLDSRDVAPRTLTALVSELDSGSGRAHDAHMDAPASSNGSNGSNGSAHAEAAGSLRSAELSASHAGSSGSAEEPPAFPWAGLAAAAARPQGGRRAAKAGDERGGRAGARAVGAGGGAGRCSRAGRRRPRGRSGAGSGGAGTSCIGCRGCWGGGRSRSM